MTIKASYEIPDDGPPDHPNCRCVIRIFEVNDWLIEIYELLDEHIGDTEPRIPEFQPEYVGILNWKPVEYFP